MDASEGVKIKVHLRYGEKDGAKPIIEVPAKPRMGTIIYTWSTKDDERIREARNPARRKALIRELSVLAYQYQGETITREDGGQIEYVFRRYDKVDKAVSDPAV